MHDEKSVVASIQYLIQQLNGELAAARDLGLLLSVKGNEWGRLSAGAEVVSVRIWRETVLLEDPAQEWTPLPLVQKATLTDMKTGRTLES